MTLTKGQLRALEKWAYRSGPATMLNVQSNTVHALVSAGAIEPFYGWTINRHTFMTITAKGHALLRALRDTTDEK